MKVTYVSQFHSYLFLDRFETPGTPAFKMGCLQFPLVPGPKLRDAQRIVITSIFRQTNPALIFFMHTRSLLLDATANTGESEQKGLPP